MVVVFTRENREGSVQHRRRRRRRRRFFANEHARRQAQLAFAWPRRRIALRARGAALCNGVILSLLAALTSAPTASASLVCSMVLSCSASESIASDSVEDFAAKAITLGVHSNVCLPQHPYLYLYHNVLQVRGVSWRIWQSRPTRPRTERLGGIGTGISKASKRVPIFLSLF